MHERNRRCVILTALRVDSGDLVNQIVTCCRTAARAATRQVGETNCPSRAMQRPGVSFETDSMGIRHLVFRDDFLARPSKRKSENACRRFGCVTKGTIIEDQPSGITHEFRAVCDLNIGERVMPHSRLPILIVFVQTGVEPCLSGISARQPFLECHSRRIRF